MSAIVNAARARGITEILHFTTNKGLVGVLADGQLLSHDDLSESQYLASIATFNSPNREKDADWTRFISMSVTQINLRFMDASARWHSDLWWAVLAFDIEILGHSDVWFTTTNNAYGANVGRGTGLPAFDDMFAPKVKKAFYASYIHRSSSLPDNVTTDAQAEVLYPRQIPLSHLRGIYVADEEHLDEIAAFRSVFDGTAGYDLSNVVIACKPDVFQ